MIRDGWTIVFLVIAALFALVGRSEPAYAAAVFWASLAVTNEAISRLG